MKKRTKSGLIFDILNILLMILLCVAMIFPFWTILMTSLVSSQEFYARSLILWPWNFYLGAYKGVLTNPDILRSIGLTVFITVVGTAYSMIMTLALAYGLSKNRIILSKFFRTLVVITMYFSAGLVPYYLLIRNLGLRNSIWVMIIPIGVSAWNYIVVRSFFMELPASLEESATIDGANDLQIFARIVLPLSGPVIATFTLFYGVGYWNQWWNAMLFITNQNLYPLQYVLRNMVASSADGLKVLQNFAASNNKAFEEGTKMATVFVATIPIVCVYPFLQKYFAKGVMIGAIKG